MTPSLKGAGSGWMVLLSDTFAGVPVGFRAGFKNVLKYFKEALKIEQFFLPEGKKT